jgi:hypothetical protein
VLQKCGANASDYLNLKTEGETQGRAKSKPDASGPLFSRRIEAIAARADRDLSREIEAVISGKLDLDMVPAPADLKIEAARAAVAPQRVYYAWDGAGQVVADVDVVRAEKKLGGTRGDIARDEIKGTLVEPHFAPLDPHGEDARFPDEGENEGRVRAS